MIIDTLVSYWEEEDIKRLEEIRREEDTCLAELAEVRNTPQAEPKLERISQLEEEANQIHWDVENRYIKSRSKKEILADADMIISAIEKQDFLDRIEDRLQQLASLRVGGADDESINILKKYTVENYDNCYNYILHFLRVQLNALAGDEKNTNKVIAMVEKRVALWYVKPQPAYVPLAHGKATDALAFMSSRGAEPDRITGNAALDGFGVQLVLLKLKELHATLNPNTDKLLSMAISTFTQQNDFRHTKGRELKRDITIPLKEYAALLGYEVDERETYTPEEAEREKKRAKNQLDNARKAIKKDLDIIHASVLSWEEPVRGKTRDFDRISLVTRTGIKNGEIKISLSPEIASYLSEKNIITQYPVKLLKLDSRKPTAYYVGRKLAEHYNIDNNQIRGTHDRISIPALLAVTDLASYEEVQRKDRGHWAERIKEPLERALDELTKAGVLKDWKYVHAKGVDLTEEEASTITDYATYSSLYLLFNLADEIDHAERIETKQKARAEAKAKRKKSASKKNS